MYTVLVHGVTISDLPTIQIYIIALFQVDVVFEEDKGFLSAIQSFMSNTKIPIILTTSDLGFNSVFDGRFEHFMLKKPPVV